MKLIVATCQFPVDSDIQRNFEYIALQIQAAKEQGADVVHFPEGSLSGYAGVNFKSFKGFNWVLLRECTQSVLDLARQFRVWILLGSSHPLTGSHKPHNSLYIIDDEGRLVDRYDKMFCAGDRASKTGDLAHYSPGNHFTLFTIKGVRCGALICHDYRYPELYREYKRRGVQVMFHSFHAGQVAPKDFAAMRDYVGAEFQKFNPGSTIPGITMPATMQAEAANNFVWISCPNTSARESCWPAFFVRPDGVITGCLRRNISGILVSTVNTNQRFYDSTVAWRTRAMQGIFHSGVVVRDRRSDERTRI